MNNELVEGINKNFPIELAGNISLEELEIKLAIFINKLIAGDFNKLLSLLYKIDVDESRLKNLLKENANEDPGKIIARLIIERQMQKLKSRREMNPNKDDVNDDVTDAEKW